MINVPNFIDRNAVNYAYSFIQLFRNTLQDKKILPSSFLASKQQFDSSSDSNTKIKMKIPIKNNNNNNNNNKRTTTCCSPLLNNSENNIIRMYASVMIGLDTDIFKQMVQSLSTYNKWETYDQWKEEILYSYTQTNSSGQTETVLCTSDKDSLKNLKINHSSNTRNMVIRPLHKFNNLSLSVHNKNNLSVVLCTEHLRQTPISQQLVCVMPTKVKIQYKRSFFLSHWKYTVLKYWEAGTLVQAQEKILNGTKPYHKIEIDCINIPVYLNKHNSLYIGLSIVLKISSIFMHEAIIGINKSAVIDF